MSLLNNILFTNYQISHCDIYLWYDVLVCKEGNNCLWLFQNIKVCLLQLKQLTVYRHIRTSSLFFLTTI